jgi:hypothetical protein
MTGDTSAISNELLRLAVHANNIPAGTRATRILAPTRWQLRGAVEMVNQRLAALGLSPL